jgi:hypothetical protein
MRARLFAVFFLLLALGGAHAAPAHIEEHLSDARLAGAGSFTWFGLAIYDAELWVGRQGYRPAAPGAAPFVLDLHYARSLSGKKIAEASAEQMKKIKAGTELQRKAWLARMLEIFPDVQQGTRISGVYLPTSGAHFYLNGKALASVPDPEFARAFFGIWLDPASTAQGLRKDLLRRAAPQ